PTHDVFLLLSTDTPSLVGLTGAVEKSAVLPRSGHPGGGLSAMVTALLPVVRLSTWHPSIPFLSPASRPSACARQMNSTAWPRAAVSACSRPAKRNWWKAGISTG